MAHEQLDDRRYKRHSTDEWRMTSEIVKTARFKLETIYEDKTGDWSAREVAAASGLTKLLTDMQAFSKGGKAYYHPAVYDTAVALRQQPAAKLTYHFPAEDKLYRNVRTDVVDFLATLATRVPLANGQVEGMIVPGTHHDHSQYPALRWSMESYAFAK